MFWRRKTNEADAPQSVEITLEEAKEATRRAAFLNFGQRLTEDEEYKQQLQLLFQTCREKALSIGEREGVNAAEIDVAIGAACDADVDRMQAASDDDFRAFVEESGDVVKRFLAKLEM